VLFPLPHQIPENNIILFLNDKSKIHCCVTVFRVIVSNQFYQI
jgi:hypothetical protein